MKAALCAVFLGAFCSLYCFDSGNDPGRAYGGGYGPSYDSCQRFTSCSTCTPVLGCGWCQSGDKGICLSDPDECAAQTSFSWTWERAFCPLEGAPPDGGADGATAPKSNDASASEAGASDAASEHAAD